MVKFLGSTCSNTTQLTKYRFKDKQWLVAHSLIKWKKHGVAKQYSLQDPQNNPTFCSTFVRSPIRTMSPVLVLYLRER